MQGIKRGITEVADAVLVTKADDETCAAANHTLLAYRAAMKLHSPLAGGQPRSVLPVSARTGRGVAECAAHVDSLVQCAQSTGVLAQRRGNQAEYWTRHLAREQLLLRYRNMVY